MNRRYNSKNKEKKKRFVLIALLILIATIAVVFFLLKGCGNDLLSNEPEAKPVYLEDDGSSVDGEAQKREREDIMNELEKQQLVVTDKLRSNITFTDSEVGTVGAWVVENPKENSIIQQAEVYLDETLIAKSTPIYPNQHITGVELLEEVDAGEYEVTAYLNYYDVDTKEFISKAGYKIHLTVKQGN